MRCGTLSFALKFGGLCAFDCPSLTTVPSYQVQSGVVFRAGREHFGFIRWGRWELNCVDICIHAIEVCDAVVTFVDFSEHFVFLGMHFSFLCHTDQTTRLKKRSLFAWHMSHFWNICRHQVYVWFAIACYEVSVSNNCVFLKHPELDCLLSSIPRLMFHWNRLVTFCFARQSSPLELLLQ